MREEKGGRRKTGPGENLCKEKYLYKHRPKFKHFLAALFTTELEKTGRKKNTKREALQSCLEE